MQFVREAFLISALATLAQGSTVSESQTDKYLKQFSDNFKSKHAQQIPDHFYGAEKATQLRKDANKFFKLESSQRNTLKNFWKRSEKYARCARKPLKEYLEQYYNRAWDTRRIQNIVKRRAREKAVKSQKPTRRQADARKMLIAKRQRLKDAQELAEKNDKEQEAARKHSHKYMPLTKKQVDGISAELKQANEGIRKAKKRGRLNKDRADFKLRLNRELDDRELEFWNLWVKKDITCEARNLQYGGCDNWQITLIRKMPDEYHRWTSDIASSEATWKNWNQHWIRFKNSILRLD